MSNQNKIKIRTHAIGTWPNRYISPGSNNSVTRATKQLKNSRATFCIRRFWSFM